jgi:CheY-like chemotaxis protein
MASIVLVEDNLQHALLLSATIHAHFPHNLTHFATESEFLAGFDAMAANAPALILMDLCLPWSVDEEGHDPARAGFRCLHQIASDNRTKHVPVIVISSIGRLNLHGSPSPWPTNLKYVSKQSAPGLLRAMFEYLPPMQPSGR